MLASEQQLEQMIDALLTLTRGQAELERREHLDLAALASKALLARESEAAARELDVRTTLATAPTAGDPRLVERLIANLIDNAIRHNTPEGHVEITTGTRDQHAFISIANTGPAVPPDQIQRPSNRSNDSTAPVPSTRADTDWDSRSSRRSRPLTVPRPSHARNRRADSPSKSHFRR